MHVYNLQNAAAAKHQMPIRSLIATISKLNKCNHKTTDYNPFGQQYIAAQY